MVINVPVKSVDESTLVGNVRSVTTDFTSDGNTLSVKTVDAVLDAIQLTIVTVSVVVQAVDLVFHVSSVSCGMISFSIEIIFFLK